MKSAEFFHRFVRSANIIISAERLQRHCAPQRARLKSPVGALSTARPQAPLNHRNTSLTTRLLRIMLLTCAVLLSCLVASASGLVVPTLSPKHTQLWQSLTYASNFERGNAPSIPRAVRTGVRLHVAPLETPSTRVSPSVTELLHGQGVAASTHNKNLMATVTSL